MYVWYVCLSLFCVSRISMRMLQILTEAAAATGNKTEAETARLPDIHTDRQTYRQAVTDEGVRYTDDRFHTLLLLLLLLT